MLLSFVDPLSKAATRLVFALEKAISQANWRFVSESQRETRLRHQLDMRMVLSENERTGMLKRWEGNAESAPESITDPVFHAIAEADGSGFRICNHQHPCEARPIQFTDKGASYLAFNATKLNSCGSFGLLHSWLIQP